MRLPQGLEQYPDLKLRYELRLGQMKDNCGGCEIRRLHETFTELIAARQKRDNDFLKR